MYLLPEDLRLPLLGRVQALSSGQTLVPQYFPRRLDRRLATDHRCSFAFVC